jgi:bifunctional ADP-heptose synthase (sugar kinase/adenylyltransferase)
MSKIIVVGDFSLDENILCETTRLCPEGPVPVAIPVSYSIKEGMAGNVLANLMSLSGRPRSDFIVFQSDCLNKKTRYVDQMSGYIMIRIDEDCKDASVFSEKEFEMALNSNDVEACVISDYGKGFLSKENMEFIAQLCISKGIPTFADTKQLLGLWSCDLFAVKINDKEFAAHTKAGIMEPWKFAQNLIVTHGANDTVWYNGENKEFVPVKKVEVSSVVGCGDTSVSGLVIRYLESKNLKESIQFANDAASIKATKRGTYAVSRDELNIFRAYA